VIVADAGPLIVLLETNKLSILKELFGVVNIPIAVYDEITVRAQEKANLLPATNDFVLAPKLHDKS